MILLDGPLGTMLEAGGIPTPPPLWSAAALDPRPDAVRALHRAYADAGATVHTAATFRTRPRDAGADAVRLTRRAVALAREAVPADHRVAGSVAPLADCFRPDLSPPDPGPEHAEFVAMLVEAGVDLLLVETFPHVGEAVTATRAAVATGRETWTALTPGFDGTLLTPSEVADGARRAADAGASVVLVNCLPAARALPWAEALASTGLRWGIYANAGPPEDGLRHGRIGAAERYAAVALAWRDLGAEVMGGCCGTGPEHVSALRRIARAATVPTF